MPPQKKIQPAKQNEETEDNGKSTCIKCKKTKVNSGFYKSNSPLYKSDNGRYPVCADCVNELLPDGDKMSIDYIEALKNVLCDLNRPFIYDLWKSSVDEAIKRNRKGALGAYLKNINLNERTKLLTFRDSDTYEPSNIVVISSKEDEKQSDGVAIPNVVQFTEEDERSKEDCIKLLGYDPFAGYALFDQKFLYSELIPYLDEDTLDDQYKISVIIQLLNNNNQIRKIDLIINKLSKDEVTLLDNHARIKELSATKVSIVTNSDKLAKENAIAIKHRGDKTAGKSTLTYLMKNYRELGFEDAEQDYYDQKKAYGMKLVADVSNRSIIEQLQFDENDINDMLLNQRKMLNELNEKVLDLEEENRQLHERISELLRNDE